ncbi:tripartite tricarboxylate transporter substrate binding protein [Rubrivivax sp. RP6-9]|uniref:tripartite tricarboxylate transporter substrate binding protein n=1 Tax=Rubrivivax sp. RP6-9 TaxID=3415750 RepID=UPI003CC5D773
MMHRRDGLLGLLALAAGGPCPARAAEALRLLVGYAAGGPADLVARQIEASLRATAGIPMRVENLPGAGGALAVQRLLAGRDDGSTWLVGSPSDTMLAPLTNPQLGYRPDQLRLVGVASVVPVALVSSAVHAQRGWAELVAAAGRAGLGFGSYGQGSHAHLAGEELALRSGVPMLHVPFSGMAPLLRELMAGRIDVALLPLAAGLQDLVTAGRLRLLAMATEARDARFPDVPTVEESTGVRGLHHRLWIGAFLPASAREAAWQRAQQLLAQVQRDADYQREKRREGVEPGMPMDADAARRFQAGEQAAWARLAARWPAATR